MTKTGTAHRGEFHLAVKGLNHITASVALRDKALFTPEDIVKISDKILQDDDFHEMVVLSTCNRSEIYVVTSQPDGKQRYLEKAWGDIKGISEDELRNHSYYATHKDAIIHLFRVISSLDSMVIGENQILGQVKDAYEFACKNHTVDFYLNYLFQAAFRVGKRIRSETKLNEGAVSISYAAVELARKVLGKKLQNKFVGVVGSGEMGELTAFHLGKSGISRYAFFNRSLNRAEKLASRFNGETFSLADLDSKLALCDIVVSSTAAPQIVITKAQVERALKERNGNPMFIIDIAAPRDVEESVQDLQNAFLFSIDDLKKVVGENLQLRREAAEEAMKIVEEESRKVEVWYHNLEVGETIRKLRLKFQDIVESELNRHGRGHNEEIRKDMEKMLRCALGKFLHVPISGLKKMGEKGSGRKASEYAEQIFQLKEKE